MVWELINTLHPATAAAAAAYVLLETPDQGHNQWLLWTLTEMNSARR